MADVNQKESTESTSQTDTHGIERESKADPMKGKEKVGFDESAEAESAPVQGTSECTVTPRGPLQGRPAKLSLHQVCDNDFFHLHLC